MPQLVSSYRDAGVDIDQANLAKKRIKALARRTFTPGVLTEIGGFGGLFSLSRADHPIRFWSPAWTESEPN